MRNPAFVLALQGAVKEAKTEEVTEGLVKKIVRVRNGNKPPRKPHAFDWSCPHEADAVIEAARRCGSFSQKRKDLDVVGIEKIEAPDARYYF